VLAGHLHAFALYHRSHQTPYTNITYTTISDQPDHIA
jgi:hypothetical protein